MAVVVEDLWLSSCVDSRRHASTGPRRRLKKEKLFISSVIPTSADVGRPRQVRSGSVYLNPDRPTLSLDRLNFI